MFDHKELSLYINLGHEQLDRYYFTRDQKEKIIPKDNLEYYTDPEFNTTHDWLLAKIIAYRKLMDYLQDRLANPARKNDIPVKKNTTRLEWTASKTDLVELIYALQASGAIKNGTTGIKEIAAICEQIFGLDLGNYYKTYIEIRARKFDRTNFISRLKTHLEAKMEKDDMKPK